MYTTGQRKGMYIVTRLKKESGRTTRLTQNQMFERGTRFFWLYYFVDANCKTSQYDEAQTDGLEEH